MEKEIKVGIAGARGLCSMMGLTTIPGVKVTALCDLDEELLLSEAKKYNIANTYRIYDDMLESDIDAVWIATPMQCHVPQAIAALEAGKHVMSEVTAGVTMDELWWLIEAVEKSGCVYMMAENYCYIPQVQQIKAMVKAGLFGNVYFGEGEYLHDIKFMTSYTYGPYNSGKSSWRKFWQLGIRGTFYPTHSLGPVMQWFDGDHIRSISCFGTGCHTAPHLRQEDTSLTLCQMESGKLIKLRVDCISNRPHNLTYYSLQGTKGCVEAPRGLGDDYKIWLDSLDGGDSEKAQWRPLSDYLSYMPDRYRNATEEQKAQGHWGGDFFIVEDFINAIRKQEKPPIDVYDACEWTAVALLSNLSVTNGGRIMDLPNFRKNMPRNEQIIRL